MHSESAEEQNHLFGLLDKIMCAHCGYTYFGEINYGKRMEVKLSEEDYQKLLDQHKNIKKLVDLTEVQRK